MPIWLQQLISVLLWVYVGYQLLSGRTAMWGKEPGALFNGKWVYRNERPGTYWTFFAFTTVLVALGTYLAFVK